MSPSQTAAALFIGAIVQEEIATVSGALAAVDGQISAWVAAAACCLGTASGDLLWFGIGRLAAGGSQFLLPSRVRLQIAGQHWVDTLRTRGSPLVFLSRFLPGARSAILVSAGLVGVGWGKAASAAAASAFVYTSVLFAVVFFGGSEFVEHFGRRPFWLVVWGVAMVALWIGLQRIVGKRLSRQTHPPSASENAYDATASSTRIEP